mmetsp:Transcript_89756/g.254244  ORF Transcript_89756/g.254244 Transcript_89756/m.254244 type:complete len:156 (+) Transcript_89756:214-681(+)
MEKKTMQQREAAELSTKWGKPAKWQETRKQRKAGRRLTGLETQASCCHIPWHRDRGKFKFGPRGRNGDLWPSARRGASQTVRIPITSAQDFLMEGQPMRGLRCSGFPWPSLPSESTSFSENNFSAAEAEAEPANEWDEGQPEEMGEEVEGSSTPE